ncbi:hypothetical protein M5H43_004635 [Escherichia coli]|nr:hypothetical protein [Escherichia coli]EJD7998121.1 hypothetical protein [Escherichia coli]EJE6835831.1 hypothetical protein [Escherichia coli]
MNIIAFSANKPYTIHQWTNNLLPKVKDSMQLIHPNIKYNGKAKIVLCWFIETYHQNRVALEEKNAFVILMDNRPLKESSDGIQIADLVQHDDFKWINKDIDEDYFMYTVGNAYRQHYRSSSEHLSREV